MAATSAALHAAFLQAREQHGDVSHDEILHLASGHAKEMGLDNGFENGKVIAPMEDAKVPLIGHCSQKWPPISSIFITQRRRANTVLTTTTDRATARSRVKLGRSVHGDFEMAFSATDYRPGADLRGPNIASTIWSPMTRAAMGVIELENEFLTFDGLHETEKDADNVSKSLSSSDGIIAPPPSTATLSPVRRRSYRSYHGDEVDCDEIELESVLSEAEAFRHYDDEDQHYGLGFDPDPNASLQEQAERYNEIHAAEFETPFGTPEFLARGDKRRIKFVHAEDVVSIYDTEDSVFSDDIQFTPSASSVTGGNIDIDEDPVTEEDSLALARSYAAGPTLDELRGIKTDMRPATNFGMNMAIPVRILKTGLDITKCKKTGGSYQFSAERVHELEEEFHPPPPMSWSQEVSRWKSPYQSHYGGNHYLTRRYNNRTGRYFRSKAEKESDDDASPDLPLYFTFGIQYSPPSPAKVQNVFLRGEEPGHLRSFVITELPNDITIQDLLTPIPSEETSREWHRDFYRFLPAWVLEGHEIVRAVIANTTPITGYKSAYIVLKSQRAAEICSEQINCKNWYQYTSKNGSLSGSHMWGEMVETPTYPCRGFLSGGEDPTEHSNPLTRAQGPTRHLLIPHFPRSIPRVQVICDLAGLDSCVMGYEFADEAALLKCYRASSIVRVWVDEDSDDDEPEYDSDYDSDAGGYRTYGFYDDCYSWKSKYTSKKEGPEEDANTTSNLHIEFSSISAAVQAMKKLRRLPEYEQLKIQFDGNGSLGGGMSSYDENGDLLSVDGDALAHSLEDVPTDTVVDSESEHDGRLNDDEIDLESNADSEASTLLGEDAPPAVDEPSNFHYRPATPDRSSSNADKLNDPGFAFQSPPSCSWADEVNEAAEMDAEVQAQRQARADRFEAERRRANVLATTLPGPNRDSRTGATTAHLLDTPVSSTRRFRGVIRRPKETANIGYRVRPFTPASSLQRRLHPDAPPMSLNEWTRSYRAAATNSRQAASTNSQQAASSNSQQAASTSSQQPASTNAQQASSTNSQQAVSTNSQQAASTNSRQAVSTSLLDADDSAGSSAALPAALVPQSAAAATTVDIPA